MRIYLTGGTGLLGSHFAELAIAEGASVVALARPASDTIHLRSLGVVVRTGDLGDVPSLASDISGCDAVVHAASPIGRWGSPAFYEQSTVAGTENVVRAMRQSGVKTLVYVSTISVHGLDPIQGIPISETSGLGRQFLPYDHYGRAKVKAERIVEEAHQSGSIEAVVLRPGWIYGPRDYNSYGRLADMQSRGLAIKIGNGENRLSLAYAGNVARALWLALVNRSPEYRAYLCAYDGHTTQNSYLASLARATGRSRSPLSLPKGLLLRAVTLQELLSVFSGYRIPVLLSRYVVHLIGSEWSFDQRRIERELGYAPHVSYAEGFAQTEEWYRTLRSNRSIA